MKINTLAFSFFCFVGLSACTQEKIVEGPKPEIAKTAIADDAKTCAADANAVINKESPSLKIATFDGACYNLADHRGKWVVVNFWATWCEPCKHEIPEFNALDKKRDDVEFIGLAYEDTERAEMEAFFKIIPVNYPVAMVDTFSPPADFDTPAALPLTYVIAPDGKVADKFLGPVTAADLEKVIDKKK
jgi:thiol-disulfide isomerase/thioredoxin